LQATFSHIGANSSAELSELRCEVQELIKFVALNYLAVVKAIKKRNRHLKVSGWASQSVRHKGRTPTRTSQA
jgi:SPX domain protein involved in polyphosphate accumulation